jgi:hypothetical protein
VLYGGVRLGAPLSSCCYGAAASSRNARRWLRRGYGRAVRVVPDRRVRQVGLAA